MTNIKVIYSKDENKCVHVNRTLLADGYNYYLTLLVFSEVNSFYYIVETFKQVESIFSLNEAIQKANSLLN